MSPTSTPSFGHTRNQYLAAASLNVLVFGFGFGIGWLSPALPLFLSSDTPLSSGPFTTEQLSWAGSALSVGGVVATPLWGYFTIRFGTKMTLLLLAIPQALSWLSLIFGPSVEYIILSRFFIGVVIGGAQTCVSLYFSETVDDNIRGKIGTSYAISRNVGVLLAYVLEIYISFVHLSWICLAISVIYAISFFCIPSTPKYFLDIGADEKARNALKFYKGYSNDDVQNVEFQKAFERLQTISKESKENPKIGWRDIFEPVAFKGIIIGIVLAFLSQSCGTFVFITYASTIFARSGANFSTEWSSIVLALLQIAGALLAATFVETQGRKPLLIISLAGSTFGLTAMAVYLYSDTLGYNVSALNWVPVTSLGFVIFISSVGIFPLSLICMVEALPTKVRSIGFIVGAFSLAFSSLVVVALYPILLEIIDLHGCMSLFAITCLLGTFFVIFVMDETKGKTLDLLNDEKNATTNENA